MMDTHIKKFQSQCLHVCKGWRSDYVQIIPVRQKYKFKTDIVPSVVH